jgi:hypothetical protein
MTPKREWSKDNNSGRLRPKASPKLRLKRILYTPMGETTEKAFELSDSNNYKHGHVEVLIIGTL